MLFRVVHSVFEIICQRLVIMLPAIQAAADPTRSQNATLTGKWSLRYFILD